MAKSREKSPAQVDYNLEPSMGLDDQEELIHRREVKKKLDDYLEQQRLKKELSDFEDF